MKKLKYLSTLLVAALAIIAAWLVWNYYTQSPWTRDGKVRAEQVGVTPQVSGSILQLNVRDNQLVKAGEVLFRIDDTPYKMNRKKPPAMPLADAISPRISSPQKI